MTFQKAFLRGVKVRHLLDQEKRIFSNNRAIGSLQIIFVDMVPRMSTIVQSNGEELLAELRAS